MSDATKETILQWLLKGFSAMVLLVSVLCGLVLTIGTYSIFGPLTDQVIVVMFAIFTALLLIVNNIAQIIISRKRKAADKLITESIRGEI